MEVCNYANMQVCMYVSVQCKYASVYENMQESIQICKYEKFAGMWIYTNKAELCPDIARYGYVMQNFSSDFSVN